MQLEVETQSESKQDALLTQSEFQLTSLNMTEEDRRRLLHTRLLRAELGAILARAEWEGAKRTMRGVSITLFFCLVAIMSCFMWRWRQASQHGRHGLRSREDAEEALRGHYEARRPLSNPSRTGGNERSSPPSSTQPINGIKASLPSYEEAQIPK